MDVSPRQMVSVATALIPFLEHDDANRALMGANMQRQAVPLVRNEAPRRHRHGVPRRGRRRRRRRRAEGRRRDRRSATWSTVDATTTAPTHYRINKFARSNQGNCINQRPLVAEGDRSRSARSSPTARATDNGEMAWAQPARGVHAVGGPQLRGRDHPEPALVQDDVLTSIHIEEHEVDARDTKLGPEEITRDIPNVSDEVLADLDERGIIRIGAEVRDGDILVGKVTPEG